MTRNIDKAWWAERYTPKVDLQFGIRNVLHADDIYLRMELKVGSVFPVSSHADVTARGRKGWHHDLVNLTNPHRNVGEQPILNPGGPKADVLLFVCDVGVYLTLTGHQVKRVAAAGGGRPPSRGDFAQVLPPLAEVLANRGQSTEAIGVYPRTNERLQSTARMVRPRARHPRIWYRLNDADDYLGPDDQDSVYSNNSWLIACIIGQPDPAAAD